MLNINQNEYLPSGFKNPFRLKADIFENGSKIYDEFPLSDYLGQFIIPFFYISRVLNDSSISVNRSPKAQSSQAFSGFNMMRKPFTGGFDGRNA